MVRHFPAAPFFCETLYLTADFLFDHEITSLFFPDFLTLILNGVLSFCGLLPGFGDAVGFPVGDAVGTAVGDAVGAAVGDAVGAPVGDAVGAAVGDAVGAPVGDMVGVSVGDAVGASVGDTVGASVGDAVGASRAPDDNIDASAAQKSMPVNPMPADKKMLNARLNQVFFMLHTYLFYKISVI